MIVSLKASNIDKDCVDFDDAVTCTISVVGSIEMLGPSVLCLMIYDLGWINCILWCLSLVYEYLFDFSFHLRNL